MASREYTVDEVVAAIDDWVDSDAGGMSSSEEELLDRQLLGLEGSSRYVLFVFHYANSGFN